MMPPDYNPPGEIYLIPYKTDEQIFKDKPTLNLGLTGVFETNWSADDAISMLNPKIQLTSIAVTRWATLSFKYQADKDLLLVEGITVPPEKMLLFTYQNGLCLPYETLALQNKDGSIKNFQFPIVHQLKKRYGIPTLKVLQVQASE